MAGEKERKSITVKTKGTERTINDQPVINFAGADGISYSAWGKELVPCIVVGAVLDAEITSKEKDGTTYHNVVQLYDAQGKGIRPQQQKKPWGGGQARGPEDRISEETRVAATITKDLWLGGKLSDNDPLVTRLKSWLTPRLDTAVPKAMPAEPAKSQPATSTTKAGSKPPPTASETINQELWGEIQVALKEKGYKKPEFDTLLRDKFNVWKVSELSFTQGKELLSMVKTGAGLLTPPPQPQPEPEDIPF